MVKREKLSVEPYKGVRDFYPKEFAFMHYLMATWRAVCERYGYVEYSASILEPAELYRAKGAANEELSNEQTYTFVDRGEREVTLRPEMTPSVARLVAGKYRELAYPLRWYSVQNFFRYERPQHGRLREFWQLNFDIFGSRSRVADAEVIELSYAMMLALGATENDFVIKVGSRNFLDALVRELKLDEPAAKKLRMFLDRRAKMPHGEFERELADLGVAAELISPEKVPGDVAEILSILKDRGVTNAVFDPSIVRGFDYYSGVVFELFDTDPANPRSLCGGGRYDNILDLFCDDKLPAVGAAAGDATLQHFLSSRGLLPEYMPPTKVYLAVTSPSLVKEAAAIADELRKKNVATAIDFGEKKLGDQIKAAAKHGIPYLVVIGDNELQSGEFVVRDLMTGKEERRSRAELSSLFLTL
ncbi:histidine--tRNA ligase [Patescibacteria group bacterium]|nr:histidine--tRNA ligase [Patescibacteria group bacterium]